MIPNWGKTKKINHKRPCLARRLMRGVALDNNNILTGHVLSARGHVESSPDILFFTEIKQTCPGSQG